MIPPNKKATEIGRLYLLELDVFHYIPGKSESFNVVISCAYTHRACITQTVKTIRINYIDFLPYTKTIFRTFSQCSDTKHGPFFMIADTFFILFMFNSLRLKIMCHGFWANAIDKNTGKLVDRISRKFSENIFSHVIPP
ncbi:hypothetical protein AXH19_12580 [Escherichia coli]|nr:hypothetical protein AXH19_12580 [Escherichia coli]